MSFSSPRRPRVFRGPRVARPLVAPVIDTGRLTLRPHRLTDAEEWFALQSDPQVNHFLHWPARTPAESLAHLRDRTRHTKLEQANDFLALAIELDGRLIGDVSLRLRTVLSPGLSVEIAWMLNPQFSGRGYATEAASALLDTAFTKLGADWAVAMVDISNVQSIALAERLGLHGIPVDGEVLAFFSSPALRDAPRRAPSGAHRLVDTREHDTQRRAS